MRVYISCSKSFYDKVESIKINLEKLGHSVTPPNGWNDVLSESLIQKLDNESYADWKAGMIRKNTEMVSSSDGVLVLNFTKNGADNYLGGSTFLEAYKAFELGKKLFLYNPIPTGALKDELIGFGSVVIDGNLLLVK